MDFNNKIIEFYKKLIKIQKQQYLNWWCFIKKNNLQRQYRMKSCQFSLYKIMSCYKN